MNKYKKQTLLGVGFSLLLAGCSGGGSSSSADSNEDTTAGNTSPTSPETSTEPDGASNQIGGDPLFGQAAFCADSSRDFEINPNLFMPADQSSSIPTNLQFVRIGFNAIVNPATLGDISLAFANDNSAGTVDIDTIASGRSVDLVLPDSGLLANTRYTVNIPSSVLAKCDDVEKSLTATTSQFSTGNTTDLTAPTFVQSSPTNGESTARTTDDIVVEFSEAVTEASAAEALIVRDQDDVVIDMTVTVDGERIIASPSNGAFDPQSVYTVDISTLLTDLSGNALAANETFAFRTAGTFTTLEDLVASQLFEQSPELKDGFDLLADNVLSELGFDGNLSTLDNIVTLKLPILSSFNDLENGAFDPTAFDPSNFDPSTFDPENFDAAQVLGDIDSVLIAVCNPAAFDNGTLDSDCVFSIDLSIDPATLSTLSDIASTEGLDPSTFSDPAELLSLLNGSYTSLNENNSVEVILLDDNGVPLPDALSTVLSDEVSSALADIPGISTVLTPLIGDDSQALVGANLLDAALVSLDAGDALSINVLPDEFLDGSAAEPIAIDGAFVNGISGFEGLESLGSFADLVSGEDQTNPFLTALEALNTSSLLSPDSFETALSQVFSTFANLPAESLTTEITNTFSFLSILDPIAELLSPPDSDATGTLDVINIVEDDPLGELVEETTSTITDLLGL